MSNLTTIVGSSNLTQAALTKNKEWNIKISSLEEGSLTDVVLNEFEAMCYNVAYEIRLQQALEENLLCPFHYFGITGISIGGNDLDDNTDFKYLEYDQRVNHILTTIDPIRIFDNNSLG